MLREKWRNEIEYIRGWSWKVCHNIIVFLCQSLHWQAQNIGTHGSE